MDATFWIGFWAALFLTTHLATTSQSIRPRVVAALGEQPYRGIYSLISFATFIPLTVEFVRNKHAGPMLWNLRDVPVARYVAIVLMVTAIPLMVASFATPSPTAIGSPNESMAEPRGVLKITRHPLFWAIGLFAVAHLMMNGWLGDVIFFGTLLLTVVVGVQHQDARKLRSLGESYRRFCEQTSAVPGAALLSGRQRLRSGDLPWAAIMVELVLVAVLVAVHPYVFGGNPLR